MPERVFLVHGWSVQETTTYQSLHTVLAKNGFELHDIFLGRYVSLDDAVEISDIAKAMHLALEEKLAGDWDSPFHIITHSTGALVSKHWIINHYTGNCVKGKPLQNIVFLAGPHFGSRLAHHGRSMLSHARYLGDTGEKILISLELGSEYSWDIADSWFDDANWKDKGIRPFCLIGDRVEGGPANYFASKIFPAAYEEGSDMVVRAAAGNLNTKRFLLDARNGDLKMTNEVKDVPFGALEAYVHSGEDNGIMNSIKKRSTPARHQSLKMILDCLNVKTAADYSQVKDQLQVVTGQTRKKRQGFAQIDFRLTDETGRPVTDYVFKLGVIDGTKEKPSKSVVNTHKNKITPHHFTAFIKYREIEPKCTYFIEIDTNSGSTLFTYEPDPFRATAQSNTVQHIVTMDQTTQIDVVLGRKPSRNLFVFYSGDDPNLHVKWNRKGIVTDTNLEAK